MVGSLRRDSLNRRLYQAAVETTPAGVRFQEIPIGALPHFNDDLDVDGGPEPVRAMRAAISAADGLLFVTPEYNHSIPGVLKNAIDWASRPSGRSTMLGKPAAVIGAASGRSGSMRAQFQLRALFPVLDLKGLHRPDVIVTFAGDKFDQDGRLVHQATEAQLREHMASFVNWIVRLNGHAARGD